MKEITDKINLANKISPQPGPVENRGSGIGGTAEFARILSQQLEGIGSESTSLAQANGLPELNPSYNSLLLQDTLEDPGFTQNLSDSIDLLETYAAWLADPEKSLKQAFSLLEKLSDQTGEMDKAFEQLPDTDKSLKELITHLSRLVETEKIKMNRGDYT